MAVDVHELAADLAAEQDALDVVVSELADEQWSLPTPRPGWTIADQIGHLTYFDGTASLALEDPDGSSSSEADAAGVGRPRTTGSSTPRPSPAPPPRARPHDRET
jgi:uncharacterized protein (TIGR03083 family)